jgi:hypothetical protein
VSQSICIRDRETNQTFERRSGLSSIHIPSNQTGDFERCYRYNYWHSQYAPITPMLLVHRGTHKYIFITIAGWPIILGMGITQVMRIPALGSRSFNWGDTTTIHQHRHIRKSCLGETCEIRISTKKCKKKTRDMLIRNVRSVEYPITRREISLKHSMKFLE